MINSTTEISQRVFIKKPMTTLHFVGWLLFKQQKNKLVTIVKTGIPRHCQWNIKWYHQHEKVWMSLKKLKILISYDSAIPLLGICPKELKTKDPHICNPLVTETLFSMANKWKQHQCPSTDEQINVEYTSNGILFSHKKERI